ncbi:hypothetical protein [Streptomyces sp. XH2]|uniref:hypothetical protein n=1 Tax=Streptomyces sp. XH2 TaxID=3412483 RepID=UPI003C7E412F
MLINKRRWVCTATLAVAASVSGTQAAVASPGHSGELRPARMVVHQGSANLLPPFMGGQAFLYDALDNKPLAGKHVMLLNGSGREICRAVTDSHGEAACTGAISLGPASVDTIANGYNAVFEGDEHYMPARGHGAINLVVDHDGSCSAG